MRFLLLLSVAVAGISGSGIPRFTHASVAERHHVFPRQQNTTDWPYGPYRTEGRDIVDSRGDVVTLAGINWPLNGETMIPEGLEHASVESILDRIVGLGFNIIRMQAPSSLTSH
ncbi:Endoglucanase E1 [Madurella mycetomatis]|uniref:Endoglucanase E1 n=1 Tax=Madurella mycetomatis TaxID=100816 RepID=A0A175W563_9PEZI|nr:Endoglucanase E1 [Madurella mycetomatis]